MSDLAFIPAELDDLGLSLAQFRLYCHIVRRSNGTHGACFESIPGMAEACRINHHTAREALNHLTQAGLIDAKQRPGNTTLFTVNDPGKWKLRPLPKEADPPPPKTVGDPYQNRRGYPYQNRRAKVLTYKVIPQGNGGVGKNPCGFNSDYAGGKFL